VIELPVVAGPDHPSVVVAAEEDADVDGDVNTAAGGDSKIDRKTTSSTTTVVTTQRYTDSSSIALGWNAERRTKISVNTYEEQRHYENEIRHRRSRRFGGHRFGQRRRRSPYQRRHGRARLQLQRLSRSVRKRILRRNGFDTSDIDESEGNSSEQEGEEDPSSSLSPSGEDDDDDEEEEEEDRDNGRSNAETNSRPE